MYLISKDLREYDYGYWKERWQTERLRHLGQVVLGDGLFLDLGSGDVKLSEYVKNYVGVDLSDTACLEAKRKRVSFVRADVRRLPFRDENILIVVCAELLEHLPEPRECLMEAERVLRKKGEIVVTVPNSDQFRFVVIKMLGWEGAKPDCLHLHIFTQRDIGKMFSESGFKIKWMGSVCIYVPIVDKIVPENIRRILYRIIPITGVYILAVGLKK